MRELQLDGIGFLTENRRYYPKRELASQVLGYVGVDNTGMSGVEYAFEDAIRGRAAKVVVHTDARRRPVGHTERPSHRRPHRGRSPSTNRSSTWRSASSSGPWSRRGPPSGVVVVLDPLTGEVLAMANRPTFNPNRFAAYPALALAQPGGDRRLRAGIDLQDRHRRRRHPGAAW